MRLHTMQQESRHQGDSRRGVIRRKRRGHTRAHQKVRDTKVIEAHWMQKELDRLIKNEAKDARKASGDKHMPRALSIDFPPPLSDN